MRFRDTLQSALDNKIVTLDDAKIEYKYEEIKVYRGITRKDKTPSDLNENDFLSQMEKSKKARGIKVDELSSYSCSVFTDIQDLERALFFPKPTKFIAESKISSDTNYFGPIGRDDSSHINLWLEADAKPLGSLGRGVLEPVLWFPVCGGWLAMGVAVRQPPCLWFDECRSS